MTVIIDIEIEEEKFEILSNLMVIIRKKNPVPVPPPNVSTPPAPRGMALDHPIIQYHHAMPAGGGGSQIWIGRGCAAGDPYQKVPIFRDFSENRYQF